MRNTILSAAVLGLFTVTAPGSLTNVSAVYTPEVAFPKFRSACGLVLPRPKAQQSPAVCTADWNDCMAQCLAGGGQATVCSSKCR
jgi:hypothetical protein